MSGGTTTCTRRAGDADDLDRVLSCLRVATREDLTKSDGRCSICLDELDTCDPGNFSKLLCGHIFCTSCILELLFNHQDVCPNCRATTRSWFEQESAADFPDSTATIDEQTERSETIPVIAEEDSSDDELEDYHREIYDILLDIRAIINDLLDQAEST